MDHSSWAWCDHSAQLHPGELLGAEWGQMQNAFPCTALVLLVLLSISMGGKYHSTVSCDHSSDRDAVTWGCHSSSCSAQLCFKHGVSADSNGRHKKSISERAFPITLSGSVCWQLKSVALWHWKCNPPLIIIQVSSCVRVAAQTRIVL